MPVDLLAQLLSGLDTFKQRAGRFAANPMQGLAERSGPVFGVEPPPQKSARERIQEMLNVENISDTPAGQAALNMLGAIKVFHGSPHTFDRFDLSKIGTGEGAQAYGHGLYFAENPEVAKSYMGTSANPYKFDSLVYGDKEYRWGDRNAQLLAQVHKDGRKAVINELKENAKAKDSYGDAQGAALDRSSMDFVRAVDPDKIFFNKPNNMYEASLRWPDPVREATDPLGPQHFLDWDKPLSQQPKAMQEFVKNPSSDFLREGQRHYGFEGGDLSEASGSFLHDLLSGYGKNTRSDAAVSAELRKAGIPGIRYLDAGSRGPSGTGKWQLTFPNGEKEIYGFKPNDDVLKQMGATAEPVGTANYVLFDDALAEILKRNGQPVKKPPPQPTFQQLKDYERRVQTGVEGLEGEAKYKALREIAAMLQGQL